MKNILPDKVYDILKWAAIIAFPALGAFIQYVFPAWGMNEWLVNALVKTFDGLGILVGALLCVSAIQYKHLLEEESDGEDW